jgi:pimeloyl-ACP methyl ester carboxylesterase
MAQAAMFGDFAEEKIFMGMRLSVVCAEDLPRAGNGNSARLPFGRLFIDEFAKGCAVWPQGKMAKDFDQPVTSARPVLILSGGLDPVTPPALGDEVARTLTSAAHFVAPNVGHGVSIRGCAPKLIKKFIETASVGGLDGKCLERLPRPLFYEPMRAKIAGDRTNDNAGPGKADGEKK